MKHTLKFIPAVLLGLTISAQSFAAYTVYVYEDGSDVVAEGEGTLNTDGINLASSGFLTRPLIFGEFGLIYIGGTPRGATPHDQYQNISGPSVFVGNPTVGLTDADQATGELAGINGNEPRLLVPFGYASNTHISATATWANKTLNQLGLLPETYTWTWGSGGNSDSFTLVIGSRPPVAPQPVVTTPVPTLGTFGLLGLASAIGAAGIAMNRRRKQ